MPSCHRCHAVEVAAQSDLCSSCVEDLIAEAEAEQEQQEAALRDYDGDQYLTDGWLEDGLPLEEAKRIVEDASSISLAIEMGQLEMVLADKHATRALRNLLIDRNTQILHALSQYARRRRIRRKPGRKPQGREQLFLYEQVYNLRKSGLTFGKIAQRLWEDSSKHNIASAHYQRALNHGFPPLNLAKE